MSEPRARQMTVPVCAALGTTWRARGWVRTHRWTNNGPEGGSRLLRWDGASVALLESGKPSKFKGQFFGGRLLKAEVHKAKAGYVAKADRAGGGATEETKVKKEVKKAKAKHEAKEPEAKQEVKRNPLEAACGGQLLLAASQATG